MEWYIRKESNIDLLRQVAELDESGQLEKMDKHKRKQLAEKLMALKASRGRNFYEPNAIAYKWFLMPYLIKGISGGNRCLAGWEKIYNPVTCESIRVDEIDDNFFVLSYDGSLKPAIAMKPFLKGYDYLYEIELSNGQSFVSTLAHQVYSQLGYISIDRAYRLGLSLVSPAQSTLEPCLLTHDEGGLNYGETIQGSQYDYPALSGYNETTIDNCRPIGTQKQPFYDFHVPFYNNYFHKGIVHHNSGKTATIVMDVVMQMEGWHPLQRENLKRLAKEAREDWVRVLCEKILKARKWIKSPPISARCVTVDYDNYVDNVVGPEFMKWASQDMIKDCQYDNEKRRRIRIKNDSFVEFMTYKQDISAHGGAARDVIIFDEEPPNKDMWTENLMRVISTKGRMTLGMTAVNGVTWTKDEIWEPGFSGKKNTYTVRMTTYDNPINDEATVDLIKSKCIDDVDVAIRIHGEMKSRGGNVYKSYRDEHPWIVDPFEIPDSGIIVCAIDPHPKTAHAVLWAWVDPDGIVHDLFDGKPNVYFINALFVNNHIPGLAALMEIKEKAEIKRDHDICLCDPSAWIRSQAEENSKSIAEQFEAAGIYPIKGSKDLAGGILKVNEMLSLEWTYPDKGTIKRERPQAMIFNTDDDRTQGLGRLRWELKNYRWAQPSMNSRTQAVREKPVDRDDHLVEDHRRIIEYVMEGNFETENIFDLKPPKVMMNGVMLDINDDDDEDGEWENAFI